MKYQTACGIPQSAKIQLGDRQLVITAVSNEWTPEAEYTVERDDGVVAKWSKHHFSAEDVTIYAGESDRQFYWTPAGSGYCGYCLGDGELIENAGQYRLISVDDPCQCENCGIWAGDAFYEAHSDFAPELPSAEESAARITELLTFLGRNKITLEAQQESYEELHEQLMTLSHAVHDVVYGAKQVSEARGKTESLNKGYGVKRHWKVSQRHMDALTAALSAVDTDS